MSKIYLEKLHAQFRRKTLAEWQAENPVLCDGEIGVVTDGTETEWLKLGDGVTAWNDLPFKKGPRGEKGETGAQGIQGIQGVKGDKGDKGDTGAKGNTGAAAGFGTPTVSVTQLAEGEKPTATVTASGADTAKVFGFNFGIPKGDKGDTGDVSAEQLAATVAEERLTSSTLYANALKGSASGEVVRIDDIAPNEHNLNVRVKSKNLIKFPYQEGSLVGEEISRTVNSDGTITLNGTVTVSYSIFLGTGESYMPNLKDGKIYRLSGVPNGQLILKVLNEDGNVTYFNQNSAFTWSDKYQFVSLYILYSGPVVLENELIKPMLELGNTTTDYTAYVSDLSTVSVTRYGKNLIPYPLAYSSQTINGVTFTVDSDGSIKLSGTSTEQASFYLMFASLNLSKGVTYTLSASGDYGFGGSATVYIFDSKNLQTAYIPLLSDNKVTFTPEKDIENTNLYIVIPVNRTVSGTIKLQLELGSTATEYEPYADLTAVIVTDRRKNLSANLSGRNDVFFSGSPTTTYSLTGNQLIKGFAVNGNATNYHVTDFINSMGTVTFKTSNINYTVGIDVEVVQGATYTVSANITNGTGGNNPIWIVFLRDGLFQSYTTAQRFTVPNNCNQAILLIRPAATDTECSFSNVQLKLGEADYGACGITSVYPTTTLLTDTEGVIMDVEYNRDINKAFAALEAAIAQ